MSGEKKQGSCLCGGVAFMAQFKSTDIHVCHCQQCRQWNGGPSFAAESDGDVAIENEENLVWYESSEWAKRGFCKCCGTNLFYKADNGFLGVWVANLEGEQDFKIAGHIFIDCKAPYYEFADNTPRLTGAEFLKKCEDN